MDVKITVSLPSIMDTVSVLEFRLRDSDVGLQPGGYTCVGFHV